ncbi:MAG: four helix bundle protein [Chloroflexota bacterium]
MAVKNYRELVAWQKAMDLAVSVYKATKSFPNTEIYGLTSQLRRAAVSISSNIAEGQGRHTTKEFLRFLGIAYGSLQETETQIILATRLGYVQETQEAELLEQCAEVGRLLNGLINALQRRL